MRLARHDGERRTENGENRENREVARTGNIASKHGENPRGKSNYLSADVRQCGLVMCDSERDGWKK